MIHWSLKSSSTICVLIPPVRCMTCLEHSTWEFASNLQTSEHGVLGLCRREAGRKERWSMEIKKIYFNENEKGTLICEKCGKTRVVDLSDFKNIGKPLKVKCSCGHFFFVSIEVRKFY